MIFPLAILISAQASETNANWRMSYSDQEGLHKLIYDAGSGGEAGPYLRCRAGEGWIFLIHDLPPVVRRFQMTVSAGGQVEQPSYRAEYDETDDTRYSDMALAASSKLFDEFIAGKEMKIFDKTYPVRTLLDQRNFAAFRKICDSK